MSDVNGSLPENTSNSIMVVDSTRYNINNDETYPLTDIAIPKEADVTGERFSGFPLTEDILNFFYKRGDIEGHIYISPPHIYKKSSWLQVLKRILPLVPSRWDSKKNKYVEIVSDSTDIEYSFREAPLSDPSNYQWAPSQPILVVPVLPVLEQVHKTMLDFFSDGTTYYSAISDHTEATDLLPPTKFQLTTALYFLIHSE